MNEISVCLTFDVDAESAQIRKGEDPVKISKGQFAIQRGVPRILDLLKKYDIRSTFFVCGWVAEKYPETIQNIISDGHEIAAHGYLHEELDTLEFNEETIVHEHTNQILEDLAGQIKGFRAPYWKFLMDEDRPYIYSVPESPRNLVEFPVEWYLDDWILFEQLQQPPTSVFEIWKSQFDAIQEIKDMEDSRRVYTLTCHPACIGHAYRIQMLERLIRYMKSKQATFSKIHPIAVEYLL
ncbi:MAG: polysaccharide deacetylase family protein [Candidatus Heimdallarchaeaceae archaeon]